jgi:hypothetical protein
MITGLFLLKIKHPAYTKPVCQHAEQAAPELLFQVIMISPPLERF